MRYIIATLIGLSIVGGTAFAAGNAKPGDLLFPVKKAGEQLQLSFTASDQARAALQAKFAQERVDELTKINAEIAATTTPARVQAKAAAETEVHSALTTLQHVQAKLQAKGNATAAAAISQTIIRLQNKISVEDQNGNSDPNRGQNRPGNQGQLNGTVEGTSTASTTLPGLLIRPNNDRHKSVGSATETHGNINSQANGMTGSQENSSGIRANDSAGIRFRGSLYLHD